MKRIHITRTLHLLTVALCIFFPDKGNNYQTAANSSGFARSGGRTKICQLSGRLLYRTGRYNHPAIYHKSR